MPDPLQPEQAPPSRARRMWAPVAVGVGAIVALTYVALVDPNQPGHYLACPTKALLGIDCPGCGGLRATHDLLNGDLLSAMDHNILLIVAMPLVVALWVVWLWRRWSGAPPRPGSVWQRRQGPILMSVITLVLVFAVVRNFVPYLGSDIG